MKVSDLNPNANLTSLVTARNRVEDSVSYNLTCSALGHIKQRSVWPSLSTSTVISILTSTLAGWDQNITSHHSGAAEMSLSKTIVVGATGLQGYEVLESPVTS